MYFFHQVHFNFAHTFDGDVCFEYSSTIKFNNLPLFQKKFVWPQKITHLFITILEPYLPCSPLPDSFVGSRLVHFLQVCHSMMPFLSLSDQATFRTLHHFYCILIFVRRFLTTTEMYVFSNIPRIILSELSLI